jgi:HK97 family phage major capsid protein
VDKQTTAVLDELKSAQNERTQAWQELDKLRNEATDDDGNIRDNALEDLKSRRERYEEKAGRVLQLEEKLQIVGGSSVDKPESPFEGKPEQPEEGSGIKARSFREGLERFIQTDEFKSVREKRAASTGEVELKTLFSEDEANAYAGSGGPYLTTDYRPGVQPLRFQRLTVADLLAQGTTNAVSVTYFREVTWTNAAASVAEAGQKPEDTFVGGIVTEPVRKIAHIATITDEMLEDGPSMASYLDLRLRLGVQQKEEALLYGGDGNAPNLKGIINRTGVQGQPVASDSGADAIYKAITKVRTGAFVEPDGIIIHPSDWESLRLSKDTAHQYYGGGPFTGAYGNGGLIESQGILGANSPLWGQLRVVVTTAATQGTALVGAFATEAQIFRRTGLTVESTNSHDTNFAYNKMAFRAEERLALAVYHPAAFCKVTGTSFTAP